MNSHETLPTELRLSAPPTLPQARSYMFKQRSEYSEYDLKRGNKIRINIPRLQRTYLSKDSYLRFWLTIDVQLANLSAAPLFFDRCGAFGLIDRIEVYDYLGSTLIEQIQNVPELMVMRNDLLSPIESFNSKLQTTQGFQGSMVGTAASSVEPYEFRTANSGQELFPYDWNNGRQNAYKTFQFCIPIPSFLGMFSDKFVPLHNGFSIDLFLNSPDQAFVSFGGGELSGAPTTNPNYDIAGDKTRATIVKGAYLSGVELCAQVMELGNDAENLVLASNGNGPLVIPATFHRYFADIVKGAGEPDQSTSFGVDLNLNVVSLKNIKFGMRPTFYQNTIHYPAYGHRMRNFLTDFSFQYGSSYLPELAGVSSRATTIPSSKNGYGKIAGEDTGDWYNRATYNQAYCELLKTGPKNHWSDPWSQNSINGSEYMIDTATGYKNDFEAVLTAVPPPLGKLNCICGKFMGGLDLRLSSKEVVSGIDTNGLLVRLNGKFDGSKLSLMNNAVLDIFCEHDAFVQIIPGVATTVTF
jgi:hypothetical protein